MFLLLNYLWKEKEHGSTKEKNFSILTSNYHEEKAYRVYRAGKLTEKEYKQRIAEIEAERQTGYPKVPLRNNNSCLSMDSCFSC